MTVKLDMSGMDAFTKKLQDVAATQSVPLPELMPDEFMAKYTNYPNLQAMVDAGGVNAPEDFQSEAFSKFVSENSQFSGTEEMMQTAQAEYYKRKLDS